MATTAKKGMPLLLARVHFLGLSKRADGKAHHAEITVRGDVLRCAMLGCFESAAARACRMCIISCTGCTSGGKAACSKEAQVRSRRQSLRVLPLRISFSFWSLLQGCVQREACPHRHDVWQRQQFHGPGGTKHS